MNDEGGAVVLQGCRPGEFNGGPVALAEFLAEVQAQA